MAGLVLAADALFLMSMRIFSLGVTLPLVVGCGLVMLGIGWQATHGWIGKTPRRRRMWRAGWLGFWLWLATVGMFWTVLAQSSAVASSSAAAPAAAIVVLGSGTPGGKVSPVLAARLDAAYARAQAQPKALVVVSGGIDFNEARSEGEIMGDYLRVKGLATDRIVEERESTSTEQNLLLSKVLLQKRGITAAQAPIELVTSDFHTVRARWIALRGGYTQVRAVGAPTPLYVRYNAWLREYFAVLSGFVLREY